MLAILIFLTSISSAIQDTKRELLKWKFELFLQFKRLWNETLVQNFGRFVRQNVKLSSGEGQINVEKMNFGSFGQ